MKIDSGIREIDRPEASSMLMSGLTLVGRKVPVETGSTAVHVPDSARIHVFQDLHETKSTQLGALGLKP